MKHIINIKGYWSLLEDHTFKDTDILDGAILMNQDGWFEGFTTDLKSQNESFVFGILDKSKKLVLYKFTNNKITPEFLLNGECVTTGFDGKFEVIGVIQPLYSGVCHIDAEYPILVDEEYKDRITKLQLKLEDYKKNEMNGACKVFYESFMRTHYQMEGIEPYTSQDVIEVIEDYYDVNNGNPKTTLSEVQRLLREKPITVDYKSEDLPF